MTVIGMGEEKTPQSFRNACTKFTNLENLLDTEETDGKDISQAAIEATIAGIITDNANKGRTTGLGEIGSRLSNKYPDFDVRNYGYSYLSKYLEELPRFSLTKINSNITVNLSEDKRSMEANAVPADQYKFYLGNLITDESLCREVGFGSFDAAAANILAEVLIPLAPVMYKALKPGGVYVMSGIIDFKEEEVRKAVEANGFSVTRVDHGRAAYGGRL